MNYQQPTKPSQPTQPTEATENPPGFGWSTDGPKNSLYPDLRKFFQFTYLILTVRIFSRVVPFIAPPTYEESMFGKSANIRDTDDSEHTQIMAGWTPRYPTYNFAPSAPIQA